jgi:hypothetical protein
MRELSAAGQLAIKDIAQRYGFGVDATLSMLNAVIDGNGNMAQFNHPEFSGAGQWMRSGMTMVSDMFNNDLKGRVKALCVELSNLVANEPELIRSGNYQSQSQVGRHSQGQEQINDRDVDNDKQHAGRGFEPTSLFVPSTRGASGDWWPSNLRSPNSTGAQNDVRYAYFAQARRLAIDIGGTVTVYDTLDHQIGGFSQQQSVDASLTFSSQHGPIQVTSLPVISSSGDQARTPATPLEEYPPEGVPATRALPTGFPQDVFATIEKLANLKAKGILSDEEFAAKKAELLSRV